MKSLKRKMILKSTVFVGLFLFCVVGNRFGIASGVAQTPLPCFWASSPWISLLISHARLANVIFCLFRPFAALAALKTRRQARGWTPGDQPRSGTLCRKTRHPGMRNWHSLLDSTSSALHCHLSAPHIFGAISKFFASSSHTRAHQRPTFALHYTIFVFHFTLILLFS
jgi:hypothetical protein